MNQSYNQHPNCEYKDHLQETKSPETLLQFFQCCLDEDPPPISEKIQILRKKIGGSEKITEVQVCPAEKFSVCADMIVGDLLNTFPGTRPYLEELHPLGMLSPTLHGTTLELFLADADIDVETVCLDLEKIINSK